MHIQQVARNRRSDTFDIAWLIGVAEAFDILSDQLSY